MAVNPGDIVRITARMLRGGIDDVVNVYHFRNDTVAPVTDAAFMADMANFLDLRYQAINADIPGNISYTNIEGINVTQNLLLPAVAWPTLVNGVAPGEALPQQVSPCVYWRTLRPKTRASKFLPAYNEAANTGQGVLSAIAVTALQLYGDAFVGVIVQGGLTLAFGAYNKPLNRFTPVVAAVVAPIFRTQKRRRQGVGS